MSLPTLSAEHVQRLLGHLESDDAFRALFQADAGAALAAIGAPVDAARCIHVQQLVSKEAIAAARATLAQALTGTLALTVHCLDASYTATPAVATLVRAA